ncbi:MAG TPA: VOC family protein [Candidatus Binatia bacterium]|jgi:catechol 2,3-dioxygenase-like lactoylglutathione lyase family enzyme
MRAKIRHVAMYTHKHSVVDNFYRTVFGMRRMTTNTLDETGKQNAERGHISDGVIGLAILSRYAGMQSGMDHYGFEVDDIKEIVRRMEQFYPKTLIAKGLDYVPFAGLRSYDPAGAQFDIAQAHIANVREGYNEAGWEQPRWINHIAIRADNPSQVAEFYEKVFELKEAETYRDDGSICMTDGKVKLLLRPRDSSLYRGLREGLDHMGFKVESVDRVKEDLKTLANAMPESMDGKLGVGGNGRKNEEDFRRCCLGQHFIADPDGVLVDMAE